MLIVALREIREVAWIASIAFTLSVASVALGVIVASTW